MGTRSSIAIKNEDGSIEQIYCHWDGYLSHNGKILLNFYDTFSKVKELIGLGDISSLKKYPKPFEFKEDYRDVLVSDKQHGRTDEYNSYLYQNDVVVSYHRDRDEPLSILKFKNFQEYLEKGNFQEYDYLFIDDKWNVLNVDEEFSTSKIENVFVMELNEQNCID